MENVNINENLENLKAKIDELKAGTLYRLLMKDKNYNKISTEQSKVEKAYIEYSCSKSRQVAQ